jgi:hypothetical protein
MRMQLYPAVCKAYSDPDQKTYLSLADIHSKNAVSHYKKSAKKAAPYGAAQLTMLWAKKTSSYRHALTQYFLFTARKQAVEQRSLPFSK